MIRYSVLIPQRNAGNELARQLPELRRVLAMLTLPYEVICIDRGSGPATRGALGELLQQFPFLRVLTLERTAGLEGALAAGIAAARGELLVAIGPGTEYPLNQIPHLIAELSHSDIIFGRQPSTGWAHAWRQLADLPARWLLGPRARSTDPLFWAARREAVAGLEAARGTARYLPWLASMRGFRVGETPVRFQGGRPRLANAWANPVDLLAVWWLRRRYRPPQVEELRLETPAAARPAAAGANRWIDGAQNLGRREADARQRDTA
ncbi:MAG TPA: glycosyltransferase family 2 protein [Pirellulales bacterium]|nr:glycosyltransferase family 2 protein [Pirellulales bacterium]